MKIKVYTAILKFEIWRLTRKLLKIEDELKDTGDVPIKLNNVINNKKEEE